MNLHPAVTARVRSLICSLTLLVPFALGVATPAPAQQPPPINGVTGTIALEGTVNKVYAAANTVIVTTIDGVDHVFHYTKNLLVHGGKGAGVDALACLQEGASVVVHYTKEGANEAAAEIDHVGGEGLKMTEGVVTRIDRQRKEIVIKFENGTTETLKLTDRAAADVGKDLDKAATGSTKITVYYTDDAGRKVAHFFKKVS